jgi:hypothetical protein
VYVDDDDEGNIYFLPLSTLLTINASSYGLINFSIYLSMVGASK